LLEDMALSSLSSGRQVLETARAATHKAGGLLVIGGIDYDAAPADKQGPGGFPNLPGTTLEAEAIRKAYRQAFPEERVELAAGATPSEAWFKKELTPAGDTKRWRWLHFAGHGFFATPTAVAPSGTPADGLLARRSLTDDQQALGLNPLLMSGLALAGANRAREASGADDGILTAEEVCSLDLRGTELVVLSACETGRGRIAGGEGVLGLQRAFHIAGARALVASFWKVDDAATSLLMEQFYLNLWQKQLAKGEALRQAQLFVLNHPDKVLERRKELAGEAAKRGLKLGQSRPLPNDGKVQERSHPAWWAAFVLSGEGR
jgi:CHAT domain-containing protein